MLWNADPVGVQGGADVASTGPVGGMLGMY